MIMKVIDLENHFYAPEFLEHLATREDYPKFNKKTQTLYYFEGAFMNYAGFETGSSLSALDIGTNLGDIRIKLMDKAGIDTAVLSASPGIETLEKENAIKYAQITNNVVAEACKKYPGRFLGTICLPVNYVDEAIKELERAKNELGLKYWHTHSNFGDRNLSDEKYLPIIAKCEDLNCPIYVHPHNADISYLKEYGMMFASAGFGYGVDTMRTVLRFILNGRFDQFPKLKLILGHMGEFFPFILKRLDNRFFCMPDPEVKCKHNFTYYFKNQNLFVTTSGIDDPDVFKFTIDKIGSDSILFGSDFPAEDAKAQVDFIESLSVPDEIKNKICYKNAEKFILN